MLTHRIISDFQKINSQKNSSLLEPSFIIIKDSKIIDGIETCTKYKRGKFLGKVRKFYFYIDNFLKGGFAKCYELEDIETGKIYAGKIIPKSTLVKGRALQKVYNKFN